MILVFSYWPHKKILATDRVGKLEHLLETRDVVVVDENSLNAPVEERGVVRLLAAQVEHLVPAEQIWNGLRVEHLVPGFELIDMLWEEN